MLKILIITDSLDGVTGGTERQIYEFVKSADSSRYRLYLIRLSEYGDAAKELEKYGLTCLSFPVKRIYSPSGILQGLKLTKYLKKEKFDIVQTYHFGSDIWGTHFADLAKVPVIISCRRDLGFWKKRYHHWFYRMINHKMTHVVANSQAVKESVLDSEEIKSDRISIIHNGLTMDGIKASCDQEDVKKRIGISKDDYVVGTVSWLRPEKGISVLIDAIKNVSQAIPHIRLIIAGDGPLRKSLEEHAQCIGISDRVHFLGQQKNTAELYQIMDVCALPSFTEGFSNVVLEAMASGCPVIASRVGGNLESIVDGQTGFLVPPKDAKSIAQKIEILYRDPTLRQTMGQNARKRVKEHFSTKQMMSAWAELYDSLLKQSKGT